MRQVLMTILSWLAQTVITAGLYVWLIRKMFT